MNTIRHDWSVEDVTTLYRTPLLELVYQAATIHRQFHKPSEVQMCTLLSIKTGGCPEDCSYCPQAARYHTDVKSSPLLTYDEVIEAANKAKTAGSSRFCMGAAWRNVRDNEDFDNVLDMVRGVNAMGLEVCCTLGMLSAEQAQRLQEAGLFAYNHNIDTSSEYYDQVISTRNYQDRLDTIQNVQKAGISVCSGGILGLGENESDRIGMLHTLATLTPHPDSVPINALVAVEGTPLESQKSVPALDVVRSIATARHLMPKAVIRLSAGRTSMSDGEQALCFLAGANSIFTGDKLLTTPNPAFHEDQQLFENLGITPTRSRSNALA